MARPVLMYFILLPCPLKGRINIQHPPAIYPSVQGIQLMGRGNEDIPHILQAQFRPGRVEHGCSAGHHGRCHGSAGHEGIGFIRDGAQDECTRRGNIHAGRAEIGASVQFAVEYQVGHGDDIIVWQAGRVDRILINIITDFIFVPIACRNHKQHLGTLDGCAELLGAVFGTKA